MKHLEEVVYEIARDALADQERLVSGIRLRTGTLVAANALVASFLGAAVLRDTGLTPAAWLALLVLTAALALAALVLWPWDFQFALPASRVYAHVDRPDRHGWLLGIARLYERAEARNAGVVSLVSRCSGAIGVLLVMQTVAWLAALG